MKDSSMADVRVVPTVDGPNMITGSFGLAWPSGHTISMAGKADENGAISLCRCGHSKDKPFCDGSHKRVGFKSTEGDATAHHD
jgi:CDGSH-type Zn-finger protein